MKNKNIILGLGLGLGFGLTNLYNKSKSKSKSRNINMFLKSINYDDNIVWAKTGHMIVDKKANDGKILEGRLLAGGHPQLYGLDADYLNIDDNNNYVYALMTLVSKIQGNEISLGQMKWLYERAIMSAVPREYIDQFMSFNHQNAKLEDHKIQAGGNSISRVLLYDVMQMIRYGDMYENIKNRNYILIFRDLPRILGINENTFYKIQSIVTREINLLNDKKKIFWEETPYKPPQK